VNAPWGLMPPDCKRALLQMHRLGLMDEGKEEILALAEKTLTRLSAQGIKISAMDHCHAIEIAAENWLQRRKAGFC